MSNVSTTLVLFAASMLPLAASAQTYLTANVPFTFESGKVTMPAGQYDVTVRGYNGAATMVQIRNASTRQTAISLMMTDTVGPYPRADTPKMTFACSERGCSLREIWTGQAGIKRLPNHNKDAGPQQIASVAMTRIR